MASGKALVLGGGGVSGIGWEIGILHGLAQAGVNLSEADLVVGTSAGSVVGAQLRSGKPLGELYEAQLQSASSERAAKLGMISMARFVWVMLNERDDQRARARIGKLASSTKTVDEAKRRAVIESRLPSREWPERRLQITAVDAESGEFKIFDRNSGVALADAVAASCAVPMVWPPMTIGEHRYIDGGMRSPANADLAAGHSPVVVIAPLAMAFRPPHRPAQQVAELQKEGRALLITPDAAARQAMGRNVLDPANRANSARAGLAQAAQLADQVRTLWLTS
jgi:NTE family protein